MKKIIMALTVVLVASTTPTFAQAKHATTHKHQKAKIATKYTCDMHPEVVKSKMGKCPQCGMKLTAIKSKKISTTKKTEVKS